MSHRDPGANLSDSAGGATVQSRLVTGVGVLAVVTVVGEWVALVVTGGTVDPEIASVQVLINLAPSLSIAYAGRWLVRSGVSADRHARILAWCLGLAAASTLLNAAIMLVFPPDPLVTGFGWGRTAFVLGALVGLAVGVVEARAIERSLAAERARVRAEEAERQRERLDYLNGLLRHEVLNAVNVVAGQSQWILDNGDLDEGTGERLEAVRRQSDRLSEVVTDVRLLIEETRDVSHAGPVDIVDVVEREVTTLRDRHGTATVTTDLPDEATVEADALLARAFGHLLENAVEHNDGDGPHVHVRGACDDETVTVTVADDGPGVPAAERDAMFERDAGSNYGLGLYLVRTLVERYGGSVELTETGPDGSTFAVELPRVTGPGPGASTASNSSSSSVSSTSTSPPDSLTSTSSSDSSTSDSPSASSSSTSSSSSSSSSTSPTSTSSPSVPPTSPSSSVDDPGSNDD